MSEKLTDLTQIGTVADNDLLYVVPAAGGAQYKATRSQIITGTNKFYAFDPVFTSWQGTAYINCGSYPETNFVNGQPFTIGFWFKEISKLGVNGQSLYNRLFSHFDGANGYELYLSKDSQINNITIQINGSSRVQSGTIVYSCNAWNYLVFQYDGGNTYLVTMNGCPIITNAVLGAPNDSSTANLILGNSSSETAGWYGAMNDFVIYNSALSQNQMQAMPYALPDGYVQRWLLTEGTGTTVNDSGPNSRTGSIVGDFAWDNSDPAPTYHPPLIF